MRILIVDDSALWIKQGKTLLEQAGHEVTGLVVSDPNQFTSTSMSNGTHFALDSADVLLVDKDLGAGITSTRFICVVRHIFPTLPIVRWTGGYDNKPYMGYLRVSTMGKPTKKDEAKFVEVFTKMVNEQKLILSGPMAVFAALDETVEPDKYRAGYRTERLQQIKEIAQLADKPYVYSSDGRNMWCITGRDGGVTKHELGHCICDGYLTADDIRPYLAALQKVITKFETADEIDERFEICAKFLKAGNLDELELVNRCY
jgi:hypothetical protein